MQKFTIKYDLSDPDPPKPHELRAAKIVASYFQSDIVFIRKTIGSTPDLKIKRTNQIWELKSPLGNGKRTISNKSKNVLVILDKKR